MTEQQTDWMWCYENPKEAAAEIDRLQAEVAHLKGIVAAHQLETGSCGYGDADEQGAT